MGVVIYETKGGIGYITLNRPERMNAMSYELRKEVAEALANIDNDDGIFVGIITGTGDRAFCAGADLFELDRHEHAEEWEAAWVRGILSVKKPMIAAVNGYALGGGLQLALGCDIRIASDNASFGFPDVTIGSVSSLGSLALSRFIPPAIAMEMLLTGERISAQEAYRVGLVSRVGPLAELMPTAKQIAEKICKNGPVGVRAAKELNQRGRTLTLDDGLRLFTAIAHNIDASQDLEEGVTAWQEKRPPVYKGK